MKLLIDIGNTRVKWAYLKAGQAIESDCLTSYTALPHKDFHVDGLVFNQKTSSIWISSVGSSEIAEGIEKVVLSKINVPINQASVQSQVGRVKNAYQVPSQLGIDRWLAVLGARALISEGALVVVDAGTAVNIEFLDDQNTYQGGAILAGPQLMHDALLKRTARIQSILMDNSQVIGKNTDECVSSGMSFGLIGAIERIVLEMQEAAQSSVKVIFTGGGAQTLCKHTKLKVEQVPGLVLIGLAVVARESGCL